MKQTIWRVATKVAEHIERQDAGYAQYRREYEKFKDTQELLDHIITIKTVSRLK